MNDMKDFILIAITIVWVFAFIASLVHQDYTALNITTPVMITVAGWLYLRKRNGDG
jgi:hypothetical protein